jgi:hypothetical protein
MSFRFPPAFHLILAGACLLPSSPGAVELPREAGDARVAAEWVKVATARSPEHGLACASRLDSDVAWKAFGASVQRGDDAATLRYLLDNLPAPNRRAGLSAFFQGDRPRTEPARMTRWSLLEQIPDEDLRDRLVQEIADHASAYGEPLPQEFQKLLLQKHPAFLFPSSKLYRNSRLLESMLAREPRVTLKWLLQLDADLWSKWMPRITRAWPPMAEPSTELAALIGSEDCREKEIGLALAREWFNKKPAEAFRILRAGEGFWLCDERQVRVLAKDCFVRRIDAAALLASLPEQRHRETAFATFRKWEADHLPGIGFEDEIRRLKSNPPPEEALVLLTRWITRDGPEFEAALAKLPASEKTDELWAARGCHHLNQGREKEARDCWARVASGPILERGISSWKPWLATIKDWASMVRLLVAKIPHASPLITDACMGLAATDRQGAFAFAAGNEAPAARATLLLALARNTSNRRQLADLLAHTKDWPAGIERRDFNDQILAARLGVDPKSVLAASLARPLGPKAVANAKAAIRRLGKSDPEFLSALVLDGELATSAATSPFFFPLLMEMAGDNARTRFRIELAHSRGKATDELLGRAREWTREDPMAALAEAFDIADADTRLKVLDAIQMVWSSTFPDAAIAWAKTKADPEQLSYGFVRGLSGSRAADAIAILHRLPINETWVEVVRDVTYNINRFDLAASANFLVESAEKIIAEAPALATREKVRADLSHAMRQICRAWITSDPPNARAFLDRVLARPKLAEMLLGETPSNFRAELLRQEYPNFSEHSFFQRLASESGVEAAIRALPESYNREALKGIFAIALRDGNNAEIQLVLTAAAKISVDRDFLVSATTHKLALGPDALVDWLESLRGNESWLLLGTNHVELMAKNSASNRLAALLALDLFFAEKPAAPHIQTRVYQSMEYFPEAVSQLPGWKTMGLTTPGASPDHPAEALAIAARLPTPLHDPLLCRCLLALGPEKATAAIAGLPPETRERVAAWAEAVFPNGREN